MGHERLKQLKNQLLCCIEGEMCNAYDANTEELGEAIDMLKDLEEALYYCTIIEAMEEEGDKEYRKHEPDRHYEPARMYYEQPRMYYEPRGKSSWEMNPHERDLSSMGNDSMMRDWREGRSPESRRMYMESKEMGHDKAMQLRELEKYMQELSTDVVDMIQDSTPDEKQYLEKKLMALASKISQMK